MRTFANKVLEACKPKEPGSWIWALPPTWEDSTVLMAFRLNRALQDGSGYTRVTGTLALLGLFTCVTRFA